MTTDPATQTASGATTGADLRPIRRLLIANRGEIARRIMRTAAARGIVCIAIHSDPDADALFVAEADLAVAIGGVTSAESYLDQGKVLAAAVATGADAIHPGYGFLSENAGFAQAVQDAGLIWVGPSPASIAAMAEKVPAKRLVAAAGVPLVPGAELPADASEDELLAAASEVGFPVLVKASAGGGGKGMRVVEAAAELVDAVAGARREAASAFGDPTVFFERYLPAARHIEVQVFGDARRVVHLFERECSIQRRHQKVVEEAPAPWLPDEVRRGLHAAAVAAAEAIDYRGAGTVEFLVYGDDYYFLEMNTRLQVEHPVTECITGIDLVGWQLDVAEGRLLPDPPLAPDGHAIEVRLYAEDSRADDLPSTGIVSRFNFDDPRLRVDTGIATGSTVSPYYDPMLAKVISHGRDRRTAAARLAAGLRAGVVHGVVTNRDLLVSILESPAFLDDVTTTAFLSDHADLRTQQPPAADLAAARLAAAAGYWSAVSGDVPDAQAAGVPAGWRNVARPGGVSVTLEGLSSQSTPAMAVHRRGSVPQARWGLAEAAETTGQQFGDEAVEWFDGTVRILDRSASPATASDAPGVSRAGTPDGAVAVLVTDAAGVGRRLLVTVDLDHDTGGATVWTDGYWHLEWRVPDRFRDDASGAGDAGPSAPVPGTIAAVLVTPGQRVSAGEALVVLEAMKMEHRILSDADGVVAEVLVKVGDSVGAHQVVARVEQEES